MDNSLMPLFWLLITLPMLLVMQRWIHRHLHGLALLLTGQQARAVIIYAIILLPGVFLHETSHWLAAKLLGVRTGGFSIIPHQQPDGSIQLGYVEYYKSRTLDPIRESIIGGAPLMVGTAVILLIGFKVFNITELSILVQTGQAQSLTQVLESLFQTPDFFLWLYLLFAIANGMMPSRSDRRAWPAFAVALLIFSLIIYFLGLVNVVTAGIARPVMLIFGYLGLALSMAIGVDLFFMVIIAALEGLISRLKGVSVVYNPTETS
jgi:hypothetical protein